MSSGAIHLNFEGVGPQPVQDVTYVENDRAFRLCAGDGGKYCCYIPYDYSVHDDFASDAEVGLFFHPRHPESEVRAVVLSPDTKTVGWLCTVRALTSDQHLESENKYFRIAAYSAVKQILRRGLRTTEGVVVSDGAKLALSDFIDEDLSVLVLHRPSLGNSVGPRWTQLLPGLHKKGFLPAVDLDGYAPLHSPDADDYFNQNGPQIRLKLISPEIGFEDFVDYVFRCLLPSASTAILQFFLYYQVIEVLLNVVFSTRQKVTIGEIQQVIDDPIRVHPLIERLKEDAAEKKRMNLLFNDYSGREGKEEDLRMACNDFLTEIGESQKETTAEALYQVRNQIFHGLRNVPATATPRVENIVRHMSSSVPDLMESFRVPSPT